ncbi:MAG TPA: hypothetical protein VGK25_04630 [Ignavibacteria bacterium]|jgi:hypothetical protein
MGKLIIYLIVISMIIFLSGCTKKSEENSSKPTFQILADKEKELNDKEARLKLKEIELEERERHLNQLEGTNSFDTSTSQKEQMKDTSRITQKEKKQQKKKEIQKEITQKFENPASTVKDYYEYIQRGINETGNFDSNMKKAHKYFPSRPVDKLKSGYRNTKSFTVVEEPKVLTQKDGKATVVSKVKQVQIVKKDGNDSEVTKTLSVTYNLSANENGEWVITGNSVKQE